MRIDAYNQIAAVYNTTKTNKTTSAGKVASARDEVFISSAGRDYTLAKQAVAETSDIREDKVADIKNKIDTGSYQVDTGDFASVLFAKFNAEI